MRLVIDSLGEELVARELIGIAGRASDITGAGPALVDELRAAERRQFESEGRAGSGGWAPLAESTIAAKGHDRILRDTDALFEALTGDSGDSVVVTDADGVDFGATLDYAGLHQTGTTRMPRRRPAQLADRDRQNLVRILQRFVVEGDRA